MRGSLPAAATVGIFILAFGHFQAVASCYSHYRLPTSILPDHYHLKIITHLNPAKNFTYDGEVSIRFQALQDTNNITLHVHNLTVAESRIQLTSYNDTKFRLCLEGINLVPKHDYYIIRLCKPLLKGQVYKVKLFFSGRLNDDEPMGYLLSTYVEPKTNETKWLAMTDFEPHAARSAFPCLDEPNYKAKFIIWLGHHKSLTALSNMPLEKRIELYGLKDYVWSIFEESLPMSTYLVAYTVNDFVYKESSLIGSNVEFRTWCRTSKIDECVDGALVAPVLLEYYEETFNIPFPLKKVDQIAVPQLYTAMENWGLITYTEPDLFFTPNVSSQLTKLSVTQIIAHELAHQWFGNLVTMKWWTDLWLNEGFATYISILGVEHISPEFDMYFSESIGSTISMFRNDAELSSHPISRQNLEKCTTIDACFDDIAYTKGSLIIRMLHNFMGHVEFFEGVRSYLSQHMYQNTDQDDLWDALTQHAPNVNIKAVMKSWTLQSGYPLVQVTRNYRNGGIQVSQHRFLKVRNTTAEKNSKCWWVPLTYTTASEINFMSTKPKAWLECDGSGKSVPLKSWTVAQDSDWIIFNIQMSGFYRVMYDAENWRLIGNALRSKRFMDIHATSRAQIVGDVLWLAWSGYHGYEMTFDIVEYLHNEREYLPWKSAIDGLSDVATLLQSFPQHQAYFNAFMRYITEPIYTYLGGLNDTDETTTMPYSVYHKYQVAEWACRVELDACVHTANQQFRQWKLSKNPDAENKISVLLRPTVYCTAIRHGDKDDWKFLWQRYKTSTDDTELIAIITSLACTRNVLLLENFVELISDKENPVNEYDASMAFEAIINSQIGALINREYYAKMNGNLSVDVMLNVVSDRITAIENLNKLLKRYLWDKEKFVIATIEKITYKLVWVERNLERMKSYLERRLSSMGINVHNVTG